MEREKYRYLFKIINQDGSVQELYLPSSTISFSIDYIRSGEEKNGIRFIEKTNSLNAEETQLSKLVDLLKDFNKNQKNLNISLISENEMSYSIINLDVKDLTFVGRFNENVESEESKNTIFEQELELR